MQFDTVVNTLSYKIFLNFSISLAKTSVSQEAMTKNILFKTAIRSKPYFLTAKHVSSINMNMILHYLSHFYHFISSILRRHSTLATILAFEMIIACRLGLIVVRFL